jgi:hypothetical protein
MTPRLDGAAIARGAALMERSSNQQYRTQETHHAFTDSR